MFSYHITSLKPLNPNNKADDFERNALRLFEKGKPSGIRAIIRDITIRRRLEKERLEKEKLSGVLEMAGATCHEFNQPMQVILGYSEILQIKISEDNPFKKKLKILKQQINLMGLLTKKLQNITKYETMDYLEGKIIDIDKASKND